MQLTRHVDANAPLCALIRTLATRPGFVPTRLPQVQVLSWDHYVASSPQIYEPSLMILAQGSKLARLGPRTLEYGAGHYLVQALSVPFMCETFATLTRHCWAWRWTSTVACWVNWCRAWTWCRTLQYRPKHRNR